MQNEFGFGCYIQAYLYKDIENDWTEYHRSLYHAFVAVTKIDLGAELDEIRKLNKNDLNERRSCRTYIFSKPDLYYMSGLIQFIFDLENPWGHPLELPSKAAEIYNDHAGKIDAKVAMLKECCFEIMESLFLAHYNLKNFDIPLVELEKNGFTNILPDETQDE